MSDSVPDRAGDSRRVFSHPLDALRYHVSGAVERGEKEPIVEIPAHIPEGQSFSAKLGDGEPAQPAPKNRK